MVGPNAAPSRHGIGADHSGCDHDTPSSVEAAYPNRPAIVATAQIVDESSGLTAKPCAANGSVVEAPALPAARFHADTVVVVVAASELFRDSRICPPTSHAAVDPDGTTPSVVKDAPPLVERTSGPTKATTTDPSTEIDCA
ncbi:MAG: hypothetical protein HY828_07310 [Actinobacteria bacterium]|nr:hypothetical protein [Actinomycetota bacterium]